MNAAHILVVDDEPAICQLISDILGDEGYRVTTAANGAEAESALRQQRPDLVLLDIWMPDIDGISLLKRWLHEPAYRQQRPGAIVMMSGHGTVETAVEATRLGAHDFIEKPISLAKLLQTVEETLQAAQQNNNVTGLPPQVALEPVGNSPAMRALKSALAKLAKTRNHVLFQGEAGSGKLTLAQWLHSQRHGNNAPIVVADALQPTEQDHESVLLGEHGLLSQAAGGSLILTNVDCLTKKQQNTWLTILKHKQYPAKHGPNLPPMDFDLLATSQRDMSTLVASGEFSRDLFDILGEVRLTVPPLHERPEDIPELISHFISHLPDLENTPYRKMAIAAQNRLRNHTWPGNVRELKNAVRQLQLQASGSEISLDEVEAYLSHNQQHRPSAQCRFDLPLREAREAFERDYLIHQLQACGGSVGELAKVAGMERTHLYRKLRALNINPKQVQANTSGAEES